MFLSFSVGEKTFIPSEAACLFGGNAVTLGNFQPYANLIPIGCYGADSFLAGAGVFRAGIGLCLVLLQADDDGE